MTNDEARMTNQCSNDEIQKANTPDTRRVFVIRSFVIDSSFRHSSFPAKALLAVAVLVGGLASCSRRIELEVREAREAAPHSARELVAGDGARLLWCPVAEGLARALSSPARRILRRWGEGLP